MRTKGILFVVASALIFGITPVFASMSYQYGNTSMNMTFFRSFAVIPILYLLIRFQKLSFKIKWIDLLDIAIASILGSALTTLLLYSSYSYIGVGTSTVIHFLYPFLVCICNSLFFKEKFTLRKTLCLVVCLVGMLMFLKPGDQNNLIGIIMALTSSITYAFYMVYIDKRRIALRLHPFVFTFYLCICISIFLVIFNLFQPFILVALPIEAYALMLLVAVGTAILASIFLNIGIGIIGSSDSSIYSLFEPLSSVVFGILLLNESAEILKIIGSILILGAIVYLSKEKVQE